MVTEIKLRILDSPSSYLLSLEKTVSELCYENSGGILFVFVNLINLLKSHSLVDNAMPLKKMLIFKNDGSRKQFFLMVRFPRWLFL